jgi:hypothetical protein
MRPIKAFARVGGIARSLPVETDHAAGKADATVSRNG